MPFGIAPPARPRPFKAPAAGYTRRDPDNIGIAIKFSPPPSIFTGGYKYDEEWTLKNFAMRRIFAPPGGHGGSGGDVPTIGFSENFGSTSFWEYNGFYLTMPGGPFFNYEDGRPRNRNVIEATYSDSAYADRFIAYGFRYAKRIANDSGTGDGLVSKLARGLVLAALLDRPEIVTYGMDYGLDLPSPVADVIGGYDFAGKVSKAYTYRSAAELISAMRVFLFDLYNKAYTKDRSEHIYSSYDVSNLNGQLNIDRQFPFSDMKVPLTRESILKAMGRLRSPKFLAGKQIADLVDHVRREARDLISGFSGEREWAAFEPKRTFERRIKGEKLLTAEGKKGGGIIVEIPPLSVLVWHDDRTDRRKRELFEKYVSQWTFAGFFVARVRDQSRSTLRDIWNALTERENFALAETYCEALYAPNPFWTTHLSGMKTLQPANMPNLGYGDTTGVMAALLKKRYRDWDDLRSNESIPSGGPLELQKWVRENVITSDTYADPQYAGLQDLIKASWDGHNAPLNAGELYYSDFAKRLVGKSASGNFVSVPMAAQPPGVSLLRSSDTEFVRSTIPSDIRAGARNDDLPSIFRAQEWFKNHYDPESDVAPVYIDPTNLVQTALIKLAWSQNFMALKMTVPKLKNMQVYDNGTYVWRLMYVGRTLDDGEVALDPNNVPEDVVKAIHPIPPSMEDIKRGLLAVDTMDIAFGGTDPFLLYIRNRFGRKEGLKNLILTEVRNVYSAYGYDEITPRMVEAVAPQLGLKPLPEDPQDHPLGTRGRLQEYIVARSKTSINSSGIANVLNRAVEMTGVADEDLSPRMIDAAIDTLGYGKSEITVVGDKFLTPQARPYSVLNYAEADAFVRKLIPNFEAYNFTPRTFAGKVAGYNGAYAYPDATIEQMIAFAQKFPPGVDSPYFQSNVDYREYVTSQFGDLTAPPENKDAMDVIDSAVIDAHGGWKFVTKADIVAIAGKLDIPMRDQWTPEAPLAPFFTSGEAWAFGENRFGKKQAKKILLKIAEKLGKGGVADLTRAEVEEYGPEFYEQPKPLNPLVTVMPGYHQTDVTDGLASYLEGYGLTDKYGMHAPTLRSVITKTLLKVSSEITFEDISDFVYDYPPDSSQFGALKTGDEYKNFDLFILHVKKNGGDEFMAEASRRVILSDYAKRFLGEGGRIDEMTIGQVKDAARDFSAGGFDTERLPFGTPSTTKEYLEAKLPGAPFVSVAAIVTKMTGKGYTGDFTAKEVDAAIIEYQKQPQAQATKNVVKLVPAVPQPNALKKGDLVIRGPDWQWQNQDGGPGNVGKVLRVAYMDWMEVRWPNDLVNSYRYNIEGKFDLTLVVPEGLAISTPTTKSVPASQLVTQEAIDEVMAMFGDEKPGLDTPFSGITAINAFIDTEIAKRGLKKLTVKERLAVRGKAVALTGKKLLALTKSDILQALDVLDYKPVSEMDQPFGTEAKAESYVKSVLADYQIEKTLDNIEILLVRAYENTGNDAAEDLSKNDVNTAAYQLTNESAFNGIDSRPVWPQWA